ncbi:hypothetical protein NECAME_00360 [Necator americanus]|uniref:Uncharacterized protein n=1 Tax=Necator americanus TaxID=51031 RepID=W2TCR3_NECAM|nr:hypothetical protein NECAME_00360 [Necator americanus]ETN78986.1 hypothetical protein NECAME_00360 [Necator americanus]
MSANGCIIFKEELRSGGPPTVDYVDPRQTVEITSETNELARKGTGCQREEQPDKEHRPNSLRRKNFDILNFRVTFPQFVRVPRPGSETPENHKDIYEDFIASKIASP